MRPSFSTLLLKTADRVNKSDYYSDILLEFLLPWLCKQKPVYTVLEIGTGRGYLSIVLAKEFATITSILATDIDKSAVNLAQENVRLNTFQDVIDVRQGNLLLQQKTKNLT